MPSHGEFQRIKFSNFKLSVRQIQNTSWILTSLNKSRQLLKSIYRRLYFTNNGNLALRTKYRVADKSLAPSGRKQATEEFDVHIFYL